MPATTARRLGAVPGNGQCVLSPREPQQALARARSQATRAGTPRSSRSRVRADVVVEGFRPGVDGRAGASTTGRGAVNACIVYCSLSGYGQTGPRAQAAGHDINYLGYAGRARPDGRAAAAARVVQPADRRSAWAARQRRRSAFLRRWFGAQRTGRGRYVDVAMADAVARAADFRARVRSKRTVAVDARGDALLTGGVPCYGVYPTQDGRWLAVGALEANSGERSARRSSGPI